MDMEKTTMSYLGYTGSVEWSEEDRLYFGKVRNTSALVSYEGSTPEELEQDFHEAAEDYLALLDSLETQNRT